MDEVVFFARVGIQSDAVKTFKRITPGIYFRKLLTRCNHYLRFEHLDQLYDLLSRQAYQDVSFSTMGRT